MAARVPPHFAPVGRLTWLARAALLTAVGWPHPSRGLPADQPAPEKAPPAGVKKIELHQLSNDELVKQVGAIWEKMSRDYLAQRRALATAEALLDDVRMQTDLVKGVALSPTGPTHLIAQSFGAQALTPAGGPLGALAQRLAALGVMESDAFALTSPTDDPVKKAVDAAKAKQDVLNRKFKLVQSQKDLLGRVATGVEGCRATTVAFQNTLADLKAYALEAGLRVKDGSLAESRLPRELKPEFLEKKKEELLAELARLKAGTADAQQEQEALARVLDEVNKAALAADAEVVEASKNLAREQKRQE